MSDTSSLYEDNDGKLRIYVILPEGQVLIAEFPSSRESEAENTYNTLAFDKSSTLRDKSLVLKKVFFVTTNQWAGLVEIVLLKHNVPHYFF